MTSALDSVLPEAPEPGQLVRVRDRLWVVGERSRSTQPPDPVSQDQPPQHLLSLVSVEDDAHGEELDVVWELEPGTETLDHSLLPAPGERGFDDPDRLEAFLDAVRWGAITNAEAVERLQAPFRAGITIEDYQLDPVVRALRMARVNLLIADDVGLGKTIEAGLVAQELLLRHRARTVLVICPASLQEKWRDELAEKFGLEFRIVDAALLRELRRTRGLYANPWTHYPRLITSIDWLKRDRPTRLLRDALPAVPTYPRTFDLLIVDEVHNASPSGRGRYAVDSLRTKTLRAIAPHFEHRLFLSATPHNGYLESFTALLELLDDQRFARGVRPDPDQLGQTMVRRLKSELREQLPPDPDGTPRFATREILPLEVAYDEDERQAHATLLAYTRSRTAAVQQVHGAAGRSAADFVLTLLKKRLFSSPAAFASTLEQHRRTVTGQARRRSLAPSPRVLARARDEIEQDFGDEDELDQAWDDALAAAGEFAAPLSAQEAGLLDELGAWAAQATDRGDTKLATLLDEVERIVRPHGEWTDERLIIFTEYRDTQAWLAERLAARGLAGERLALLYGGMQTDVRERVKAEFQASPELAPVRILLATDAASEGIDLQRHCHRLIHYEIPWNPNRLEQRNGRIDRHGQPADRVLIHHFVGSGWRDAPAGSLEADLQFLHVAAEKISAIREDLGSVGPVIAEQVEEAMLGTRRTLDTAHAEQTNPAKQVLRVERHLRERLATLRERLDETVAELGLEPARLERVVRVGLELARQPPLRPTTLRRRGQRITEGVFEMPRLTGSWALAAVGLVHPVTEQRRPITFSHELAAEHDDVVLVHLGHRLVQQCLRLLRAEVWATGAQSRLARVSARVVPDRALDELAVAAHGRLVLTGADGRRLHEEVITAAGRVRSGRFARMNVGETDAALAAAGAAVTESTAAQLTAQWPEIAGPLGNALDYRARTRADGLRATLARRAETEVDTITTTLSDLRDQIEAELADPPPEQLSLWQADQRAQYERDVDALRHRLARIPAEIDAETAAIRRRYATIEPRHFPAAVTFLVPQRLL